MITTETPGRTAYQAFMRKLYADAFEHWSYLDADAREAWEAAATAVLSTASCDKRRDPDA